MSGQRSGLSSLDRYTVLAEINSSFHNIDVLTEKVNDSTGIFIICADYGCTKPDRTFSAICCFNCTSSSHTSSINLRVQVDAIIINLVVLFNCTFKQSSSSRLRQFPFSIALKSISVGRRTKTRNITLAQRTKLKRESSFGASKYP